MGEIEHSTFNNVYSYKVQSLKVNALEQPQFLIIFHNHHMEKGSLITT